MISLKIKKHLPKNTQVGVRIVELPGYRDNRLLPEQVECRRVDTVIRALDGY
jgi:hypothetical protein